MKGPGSGSPRTEPKGASSTVGSEGSQPNGTQDRAASCSSACPATEVAEEAGVVSGAAPRVAAMAPASHPCRDLASIPPSRYPLGVLDTPTP